MEWKQKKQKLAPFNFSKTYIELLRATLLHEWEIQGFLQPNVFTNG